MDMDVLVMLSVIDFVVLISTNSIEFTGWKKWNLTGSSFYTSWAGKSRFRWGEELSNKNQVGSDGLHKPTLLAASKYSSLRKTKLLQL